MKTQGSRKRVEGQVRRKLAELSPRILAKAIKGEVERALLLAGGTYIHGLHKTKERGRGGYGKLR